MSSPPPFDPYEVLGVSKDAEVEQIKKAHRKLVIKCHPDKVQDESLRAKASDDFHKVQRSYEILVDPSERKRYDNQMRLVELKAESYARGYSSAPSPRTAPPPSQYEFRNGRMYEERVPDNAGSRFFDDDNRYYDEPRGSARKHDGYERRSSEVRPASEKKKSRTVEVKVGGLFSTSKERVQARDNHSDRKKTRDQERRRDASDKRSAYFEEISDDEGSYFEDRRDQDPRRRYEETPKKSSKSDSRRKEPRRSRDDEYADDWDRDYTYKGVQVAKDYIQRSKATTPPAEEVRRPAASRSSSARYVEVEPDVTRRSSGKRSSAMKEAIRPPSSGKERRPSIEIVEPDFEPRKVPSMPTSKSSPANLKIPSRPPPPPHRSATAQYAQDNRREAPSIRRSETTPMTTSRHNDNMPSKSSRLRHAETHDSGYSSPGTPEMYQGSSPPKTSTKYMIVEPDEEDYSRGHRTVLIDPDVSHSRRPTRSPSPHSRRTERPSLSTRGSSRPTPSRSNTSYIVSPESTPRPQMPRHESSRGAHGSPPLSRHASGRGDKLFGEVDDSYKARYSDDQVRYAKNYGPEDVNYGRYSNERRGSSGHISRDAYPNRYYPEQRPPTLERSSTFAY